MEQKAFVVFSLGGMLFSFLCVLTNIWVSLSYQRILMSKLKLLICNVILNNLGKTLDSHNCTFVLESHQGKLEWAEMLSYVLWNSWIFPDVLDSTYACVLSFWYYVTLAGARCLSYAMWKSLNWSRFEDCIKCIDYMQCVAQSFTLQFFLMPWC